MKNHTRLNSAMAMLTQATSINHVFDEDAAELGCGPIHYALELDDRLYLVCRDDDTNKMVVVPIEHWEVGNLLEAIDDPLSVLSFREIDSEGLEKVAARTIAAFVLPAKKTPLERVSMTHQRYTNIQSRKALNQRAESPLFWSATMKTITTQKTRASKSGVQIGSYLNSLTLTGLGELCDDPKRNTSGEEVQAVLTPHKFGFVLSARDGGLVYQVIDEQGQQMTFRSIEKAIDMLSDVPHLMPEIVINTTGWGLAH